MQRLLERLRASSFLGMGLLGPALLLIALLPAAMLIAGLLMARHELWLRDHCQHVQGTIVGQVCGEGPPCEKEVQFTDERGALRRALSPRPTGEVGTPATVCFLPGGESSKVYFRGDEANGIILALWASVWVIGEIRVLTSILREKTGRAS